MSTEENLVTVPEPTASTDNCTSKDKVLPEISSTAESPPQGPRRLSRERRTPSRYAPLVEH